MRLIAAIARTSTTMGISVRNYMGFDNMRIPFFRLMPYLKKFWQIYLSLMILMFMDILTTLFFTWFLSQVTDAALAKNISQVRWLLLFGTVMVILNIGVSYYETVLELDAVNKVRRELKLSLFQHMLRLPSRFYAVHHSGDLVSRLTNDVNAVQGAIGINLLNLIRMPLMATAAFIYLLTIHWKLALMCLLLGPAALLVGGVFGKLIRDNGRRLQDYLGRVNSLLHDVFAGHTVMRAFAMERKLEDRYRIDCDQVLSMEQREAKLLGWLQAGSGTISLTSFFVSMGIGAYYVAEGSISIGSLLAFLTLIQHLIYPFSGIAKQWGGLQRSLAAVERIWKVMDERPERSKLPSYIHPVPLHTGIRLNQLTFSYDDKKKVLRDINMMIPVGSTIAFVGPSGAGKSTLFQVIMGFYYPTSGTIILDDIPMDTADIGVWRSYMSYVPQESYLFTGTIRDNIAGGLPDASDEAITRAAMDSNAHEFITELPDGYDTWIGERGITLSGGQKQRITIARAILKDAPILLLDEATSSLDTETEAAVKEALLRLMKGRTTLIIAHRLSTVLHADWIVVMDQGMLVEQGTHEQLLSEQGLYTRLYERR
jgi:ATP-binding cassette subfamily B protein